MYLFYFNELLLPITPGKLTTKINGNNKTMELVNSGEINLIKFPGLTEYSFDFDLEYDIQRVSYRASDVTPKEVLDFLENAKKKKEIINFRVIRKMGNSTRFAIDQKVSIESYTIEEDSENNSDITVSIDLKQFRPYRTKHLSNYDSQLNSRPNSTKSDDEKKKKTSKNSVACLKQLEVTEDLNIRSGAGTINRVVAKFKKGEKPMGYAEFVYEGTTWFKVKHSAGDNGYGWISGKYVKILKDLKKSTMSVEVKLKDKNTPRQSSISARPK